MKLGYIKDLEGRRLDWAVASVLNRKFGPNWKPSAKWVQAGPLIEEYKIHTIPCARFVRHMQEDGEGGGHWETFWKAEIENDIEEYPEQVCGDTLLTASMRALVLELYRDKSGLRANKIEVPEGI